MPLSVARGTAHDPLGSRGGSSQQQVIRGVIIVLAVALARNK
ncbi:hypothetical protein Q6348_15645 [Isoptericola sp. b441]|uniref:Uncharacterized protein n=1 Tax=Actinotalea lenta TaxID=3064654 RepID=A0ABT9DCM9_9CELL|nr:hypothetical protein [Isoptericola sp. b441]MDO8108632.1 hypothetical protein [Isoptericola sp. b441]